MVDRAGFERLVRDALSNLFDVASLQTHPLASELLLVPKARQSRAQALRDLLIASIEKMRPQSVAYALDSSEWRPYAVLYGRYVECAALQELESRLSLSERQLRREHGRAVAALVALLWDETHPGHTQPSQPANERTAAASYEPVYESVDLDAVARSALATLEPLSRSLGAEVVWQGENTPAVLADRVVLRQIILSLFGYFLHLRVQDRTLVGTQVGDESVEIWARVQADDPAAGVPDTIQESLETARYWADRLQSTLEYRHEDDAIVRIVLSLPRADRPIVLVVDDQIATIRLFRRYLSRTSFRLVGVYEPEKVMSLARQLRPELITLDVMMPTMDGWELLQSLRADPVTMQIPVIVCSVWNEPDLARSLGAAAFVKKPIARLELLKTLTDLGLLNTSGESYRAGN